MGQIIARAHVLLRRAILTVTAIPDRDQRYLGGPKSNMPTPAPDPNVSYDNEAAKAEIAKAARFRPTRKDLDRYMEVLGWLSWLKRQGEQGEQGARLIVYRAHGSSWWRVAQRLKLGKSDDTARRWHDAAVMCLAYAFAPRIAELD